MPKSLALILLSLLAAGCSPGPADKIAAEKAELDAQIEAMKHHPSVLEREKSDSGNPRAAQRKADLS